MAKAKTVTITQIVGVVLDLSLNEAQELYRYLGVRAVPDELHQVWLALKKAGLD